MEFIQSCISETEWEFVFEAWIEIIRLIIWKEWQEEWHVTLKEICENTCHIKESLERMWGMRLEWKTEKVIAKEQEMRLR